MAQSQPMHFLTTSEKSINFGTELNSNFYFILQPSNKVFIEAQQSVLIEKPSYQFGKIKLGYFLAKKTSFSVWSLVSHCSNYRLTRNYYAFGIGGLYHTKNKRQLSLYADCNLLFENFDTHHLLFEGEITVPISNQMKINFQVGTPYQMYNLVPLIGPSISIIENNLTIKTAILSPLTPLSSKGLSLFFAFNYRLIQNKPLAKSDKRTIE